MNINKIFVQKIFANYKNTGTDRRKAE